MQQGVSEAHYTMVIRQRGKRRGAAAKIDPVEGVSLVFSSLVVTEDDVTVSVGVSMTHGPLTIGGAMAGDVNATCT